MVFPEEYEAIFLSFFILIITTFRTEIDEIVSGCINSVNH